MAVKDMLSALLLTVTTMKQKLFFNIMDVIGMNVENVFLVIEIELLLIITKQKKIDLKQLLNVHKSFELLATL